MSDSATARLFMNGRSQAIRLPKAFRFPGDRVRLRRVPEGVLIEPMFANVDEWFAALDRFRDIPFMEEGRQQPPMPREDDLFE